VVKKKWAAKKSEQLQFLVVLESFVSCSWGWPHNCRQGQTVTDPPSAFLSIGNMASLAGTFTRWLIIPVLHISWWQLFA